MLPLVPHPVARAARDDVEVQVEDLLPRAGAVELEEIEPLPAHCGHRALRHARSRREERRVGDRPFSPEGAGVTAHARGRRIPAWKMAHGWADEISPTDVAWSDPRKAATDQPLEDVTLIPYGCTNIRITEFPKV